MFWDPLLSKSCDEYPSKGGCTSRALLRCADDLFSHDLLARVAP